MDLCPNHVRKTGACGAGILFWWEANPKEEANQKNVFRVKSTEPSKGIEALLLELHLYLLSLWRWRWRRRFPGDIGSTQAQQHAS